MKTYRSINFNIADARVAIGFCDYVIEFVAFMNDGPFESCLSAIIC
jgi:lipoprotein signal peptidase